MNNLIFVIISIYFLTSFVPFLVVNTIGRHSNKIEMEKSSFVFLIPLISVYILFMIIIKPIRKDYE